MSDQPMTMAEVRQADREDYLRYDLSLPNVAFCGRMGAGKTTAAQFLVDRFGYRRRGFADALREEVAAKYGEAAKKDRQIMQTAGAAKREENEDYWVNQLFNWFELEGYGVTEQPWVVDDLRFPNEYWRLKEEGFVICRVAAEEDLRVDRLMKIGKLQSLDQLEHKSEVAIDGYGAHYVLFNQGEEDHLHKQVIEMLYKEANRS